MQAVGALSPWIVVGFGQRIPRMTYRAPVADIAFTLKHGAGLSSMLARARLGRISAPLGRPDWVPP